MNRRDVRRSASRVYLARPATEDCEEFLRAVRASREFHRPWVRPLDTAEGFVHYVARFQRENTEGRFLRRRDNDELVGVFELSEITRGVLQSVYLGFYALAPNHGQGLMREGLELVLRFTFNTLRLHRAEANIQPDNPRSIGLVRRCGFRLEGYSPRYLKIGGRWRDHERWAILAEDWRAGRESTHTEPVTS